MKRIYSLLLLATVITSQVYGMNRSQIQNNNRQLSNAINSGASMSNLNRACSAYTNLTNAGYTADTTGFAETFGGSAATLCPKVQNGTLTQVPSQMIATIDSNMTRAGTDPAAIATSLQDVADYAQAIGASPEAVTTLNNAATNLTQAAKDAAQMAQDAANLARTNKDNTGQSKAFVTRSYDNVFQFIDSSFKYSGNMIEALKNVNKRGAIPAALNTFINDLNTTLDEIIANAGGSTQRMARTLADFGPKMSLAKNSAVRQVDQTAQLGRLNKSIDDIRTALTLPDMTPQASDFDDALTNLSKTAREAKGSTQAGAVKVLENMIAFHNKAVTELFDTQATWNGNSMIDDSGNVVDKTSIRAEDFNKALFLNDEALALAAECKNVIQSAGGGASGIAAANQNAIPTFERIIFITQAQANALKTYSLNSATTMTKKYATLSFNTRTFMSYPAYIVLTK